MPKTTVTLEQYRQAAMAAAAAIESLDKYECEPKVLVGSLAVSLMVIGFKEVEAYIAAISFTQRMLEDFCKEYYAESDLRGRLTTFLAAIATAREIYKKGGIDESIRRIAATMVADQKRAAP